MKQFDGKQQIVEGNGTTITLKKHSTNEVEKASYEKMLELTKIYSNKEVEEFTDSIGNRQFTIEDEQSVDSCKFFHTIEAILQRKCKIVNENTCNIRRSRARGGWEVLTNGSIEHKEFEKIFICAGAWSEEIISSIPDIRKPKVSSIYGVGSALEVFSELDYVKTPKEDKITRTPNRGGTCGIHCVPRENGVYIGASSVITRIPLKSARISSIATLIEGTQEIAGIDTQQMSCQITTGYRPVTLDTTPIIGEISEGCHCIYGTKRDGFTWAPFFAKCIIKELKNNILDEWGELKHLCGPYREMISAGTVQSCTKNYVLNKKFEAAQHNKELSDDDVISLEEIAIKAHHYIEKLQGKTIGIDPEIVNTIFYGIRE